MKHSLIITVMFIMLMVPSSAAALAAGQAPWGQQFCDSGGYCVTPQMAQGPDGSVWEQKWLPVELVGPSFTTGPTTVRVDGGWEERFAFYHRNQYRWISEPFEVFSWLVIVHDDGTITGARDPAPTISRFPDMNTPDCGRITGAPPVIVEAGPGVADDPTMKHQCFPDTFGPQGEWLQAPTPPPASTEPAATAPVKAVTCTPITVARKHVTVTSTGVACASGRNILAKYMKSGAEPKGWVCTRLAVGKARTASCGTPSKSAKRIVGRWRA